MTAHRRDIICLFVSLLLSIGILLAVSLPAAASSQYQYPASCQDCHGLPPNDSLYRNITSGGFVGNHGTHAAGTSATCARCHNGSDLYLYGHMNDRIDLSDNLNASPGGARYIYDGLPVSFKNRTSNPEFGSCTNVNCHFENASPLWGSTQFSSAAQCSSCHSVPGPSAPHVKHDAYYSWATNGCATCHPNYASGPTFSHATSAASRGIRVILAEGSYSGSGLNWLPSQSGSRTVGNCSNVYCHSDGQNPATYVTQPWSGTLGCAGCHGDAAADTLSGAHSRHVNNPTLGTNFSCAECHAPTATGSTVIFDRSRHVNRLIDYSGARAGGNASCSNFYCHSDGNGTYVNPPAWTSGASLDCNGCHKSQIRGDDSIKSGKHGRHLDNYTTLGRGNNVTCRECHSSTLSGPGTINSRGNHVNGLKNYSGIMAGTVATPGSGKCSNVYCHSSGSRAIQYWNMSSANWYSARTLSCNGCHGGEKMPDGTFAAFTTVAGEPAYANGGVGTATANSHQAHVQRTFADTTGCARCHTSTVDSIVAAKLRDYSSTHLDRQRDVVFSAAIQGRYSATTQQCLNMYCHSNVGRFDNSTTVFGTPRWGDTVTCASCHADPATAGNLSGRHGKHTFSTIYTSRCDRCHNGTLDANGNVKDKSKHANRSKDVFFSEGGSYNSETRDCATYCHSDARGGTPAVSVNWGDTGKQMQCYSCHKGRTGDSTESNCNALLGAWSSVRGGCTPDLTMESNGHHRLVGPQWIRKYPCSYCHNASVEAVADGNGNVADGNIISSGHVNGAIDIKMAAKWEIPNRAEKPSYDPATKTCDNVYCHSDGTAEPEDVRPVAWSAVKTECNSCHGHPTGSCNNADCHDGAFRDGKLWTLPEKFGNSTSYTWAPGEEWMGSLPMFPNEGPGTARANSHPRHTQTNFTCDVCHAKTIKGDCFSCHQDGIPLGGMGEEAHIDAAFHVNKRKDVNFKDMSSATYDPFAKTCSGTTCHTSGADPVWGATVSAITCLSCHSVTSNDPILGADVDDYDAFNGTQGKINLTQWETTGHGRYSSVANTGSYPKSGNPAASFPGNPCWYCHDNSVLHSDATNPYRLKMHVQYERRFEKECVYCHMQGVDVECLACHVGQINSLSPQATTGGILFTFRNGSTELRYPTHTQTDNCVTTDCHDADDSIHDVNAGSWTPEMKADVKNQYMMMGVCLQCHDDDSSNQCTSCHLPPPENPLKYALGYDPGTGFIKPRKARASAGHFGYKHYRAFTNSGGWQKRYTSVKSPVLGTYSTYAGTWKGGKFCWDCHDPHGDSNIYMVQKKVSLETDGWFGKPVPGKQATVVFTDKLSGANYVKKTGQEPIDGICNVCHSSNSKHFTSISGDSHNYGRVCTTCHEHRFADSHASQQSCDSCHESSKPIPKHTAFGLPRDCTKCHTGTVGLRMDVMGQMKSNSHHVQGVDVTNKHCYACHWEATPEGLIDNQYHTGYNYKTYTSVKNDVSDLVIWGPGANPTVGVRPSVYRAMSSAEGRATAVTFLASNIGTVNERTESAKLNVHCISCHSDQNNDAVPFDDCKTPRQYAWDYQSIDARYSQKGTTTWGKYNSATYTNANKKSGITKALSAHGNAVANQGGFATATGYDAAFTGTRGGANNVTCFDCHSSHGSKAVGVTSSYVSFNGLRNGGNLKETQAGKGGYAMAYKAEANTQAGAINPYSTGAAQCFDCHLTQNAGTTPWGYQSTFGATAPISGYRDTVKFGQGTKQFITNSPGGFRNTRATIKGGHLKASSMLNYTTLLQDRINGLCTPCHDPHGVSPTLGSDKNYAAPLLKGTWLTSLYKDDQPQPTGSGSNLTPIWRIDRNTLSTTNIYNNTNRISESDSQFAGLCLKCHKKDTLTDGTNKNGAFKSLDRIHESVQGWGANDEHSFPCSKCHQPHNSGLPRLMQTNCLNYSHRGNAASGGSPAKSPPRGGNWQGFPRGTYNNYLRCHGDGPQSEFADPHTGHPDHFLGWPGRYKWNNVTNW